MKRTRTICTGCHCKCGAVVYSEDNHIVRIEGDPENPSSHGTFCGTGLSEKFIHEDKDRVIHPLKRIGERGEGKFEPISWDEALDIMTDTAARLRKEYGDTSVVITQGTSRTTDDWGKRLKATTGNIGWGLAPLHVCLTPNVLPHMFTLGTPQPHGADIEHAQTIVVWGSGHLRMLNRIKGMFKNMDENGAKLVIIDPRFTDLGMDADLNLQLRPGTDGALALGIMHIIIEEDLYDKDFIDCWTYGFNELADLCKEWTPEKTAETTWLSVEDIYAAAHLMAGNKPTTIWTQVGAGCQHSNAVQSGRAIACLAGLLGPVDVPGGFVFGGPGPQGALEVTLEPEGWNFLSPDAKLIGGEKYPAFACIGMAHNPYMTFEAMITGEPWPIKMVVFIANDALNCYEAPQKVYEALTSPNLDLIVVKDFYITPTAKYADLVLPTADWSERDVIDEGSFGGLVISSERAVDPPGDCWSDWRFMLEWGKRMNAEQWPWETEKDMLLWRLKVLHGMDLTWDEYVDGKYMETETSKNKGLTKKYETGELRPDKQPGFATQSGRIEFYSNTMARLGYEPLPVFHEPYEGPVSTPEVAKDYPYVLTTGFRLPAFFHSAWTNVPDQRQLYPNPFVLIHPDDARREDIEDGEWITISSLRGSVMAQASVSYESKKGVVNLPRPCWRDECDELDLQGYDWTEACINKLIPGGEGTCDPGFGAAPMRSTLCLIKKGVDLND